MDLFIVLSIIISLIALLLVSMVTGFSNDNRTKKQWLVNILVSIAIGVCISGFITLDYEINVNKWNGGYCTNCSDELELKSVTHIKHNDNTYFWECPTCKKVIKTDYNFRESY